MQIEITNDSLTFLEENNIQTSFLPLNRIKVGEKITFKDDLKIEPYVGFHGSRTFCPIGFQSYSSSHMPINVEIGRYCSLSWQIDFPSFLHPINSLSTSPFTHDLSKQEPARALQNLKKDQNLMNVLSSNPQKPHVVIQNDVWVGQHAVLMAGVVLQTGTIVASHSVVTKTFPPYSIIGGNPARLIRNRFPDDLIAGLLNSEWWAYSFTDFNHLAIDNPPPIH